MGMLVLKLRQFQSIPTKKLLEKPNKHPVFNKYFAQPALNKVANRYKT
jgi:hypothetical protein